MRDSLSLHEKFILMKRISMSILPGWVALDGRRSVWNEHSNMVQTAAAARQEATSRRVLEAALALFAERGYHGTSIPSVMDRARVGAGSLYRLFPSKEALVNAVFRDAKGRLERA